MHLKREFIQHVVNDAVFFGPPLPANFSVAVCPKAQALYVAKENVDLHDQLKIARANSVAAILCQAEKVLPEMHTISDITIVAVQNVEDTLYRLAQAWREHFSIPIVGVTGSFGKTSTVRLLVNILQENGMSVHHTDGHVRTPRDLWIAILNLHSKHEAAVFEVGITQRGMMFHLVQALRPTTAVITGVGHSHLQGLGSIEDAAYEMRQIFGSLDTSGVGVIYGDQPLLARAAYTHPVIKFGAKTTNQVQARKVQVYENATSFVLKMYGDKFQISLEGSHEGRVHNTLAAAAVARLFEIPMEVIIRGIQKSSAVSSCFQFLPAQTTGAIIIDDTASISPESTRAGLSAFNELKSVNQKVLVLSDMPSLGVNAPFWHRQIGRYIKKLGNIDHIILVGSLVSWVHRVLPKSAKVTIACDWKEAYQIVQQLPKESCVLVKGDPVHQFDKLVKSLSA